LALGVWKTSPWANALISCRERANYNKVALVGKEYGCLWHGFFVCNDIIHSTFIALHTKCLKHHNTCKQLCKL
jgi:hypothetical protein